MTIRSVLVVAGIALLPAAAMAQWSDNFDSYPSNVNINGLGGWQGWANVPAQAPVTSTAQSLSGPNSILCSGSGATGAPGYSDNVHQFSGYTAGWWEFTAYSYVPTSTTGDAYFILMNKYADPSGPFDWSCEFQINGNATGTLANSISDDYTNGTATPSGGNVRSGINRTLIRDSWVQIRIDFNPATNQMQSWYNGTAMSGGNWKTTATSASAMVAIDLYSNASTGVFYDNLSLTQIPAPGSIAILGLGGLLVGRRRR